MRERHGPAFLVIGAQKCGTTWLHQNLQTHPGVWLPPEKELHYFDERSQSELSLARRIRGDEPEAQRWRRQVQRQWKRMRADRSRLRFAGWYARFFLGNGDDDWYASLFRPAADQIAGEVTPDYGILPPARISAIRDGFPDVRLVLLVRSPIERLWSHAKMEVRLGVSEDAGATAIGMLDRARPRAHSDHLATIDRWTEAFGPDRLWLGFTEDVHHHPREVLHGVTDHIGASRHNAYPKAGRVIHGSGGASTMPQPVARALAVGLLDELRAQAARLGGPATWWLLAAEQLIAQGDRPGETLTYPLWDDVELAAAFEQETGHAPAATCSSGRLDEVVAAASG